MTITERRCRSGPAEPYPQLSPVTDKGYDMSSRSGETMRIGEENRVETGWPVGEYSLPLDCSEVCLADGCRIPGEDTGESPLFRPPGSATLCELLLRHREIESHLPDIDLDDVLLPDKSDGPAGHRLRGNMTDAGPPRPPGESAVGDEGHPLVPEPVDGRGRAEHLRHPGATPGPFTPDNHHVPFPDSPREHRPHGLLLTVEDPGGAPVAPHILFHGGGLYDGPVWSERAPEHPEAARRVYRLAKGMDDLRIGDPCHRRDLPDSRACHGRGVLEYPLEPGQDGRNASRPVEGEHGMGTGGLHVADMGDPGPDFVKGVEIQGNARLRGEGHEVEDGVRGSPEGHVDPDGIPAALRSDDSAGGDLFPHELQDPLPALA